MGLDNIPILLISGTIIARGNKLRPKAVLLELYGSTEFGIYQKLISERDAQGTLVLLKSLDYEKRTTYHLTVLANVRHFIYLTIMLVRQLLENNNNLSVRFGTLFKHFVSFLTGHREYQLRRTPVFFWYRVNRKKSKCDSVFEPFTVCRL